MLTLRHGAKRLRDSSARWIFALLVGLAWMWSASGAVAAQAAGSQSFRPETHVGRTHVYRLVSTGSVSVEGPQPHVVTFQLSVEVTVHFGTPDASGMIPLRVTLGKPDTLGLDASVAEALDAVQITGALHPNGALADIHTPPVLEELGLDLGDLIVGLIVPRPEDPAATSWSVRFVRARRPESVPRSAVLEGTFTPQGLRDWGTRILSSVTARLRGEALVRQGAVTNQIDEIGHALYYLDPETGATEMSSVSIVTNIRTTALSRSEVRTRITLTTTLERRRDRERAAAPPARESDVLRPEAEQPESGQLEPQGPAADVPVTAGPLDPQDIAETSEQEPETPQPAEAAPSESTPSKTAPSESQSPEPEASVPEPSEPGPEMPEPSESTSEATDPGATGDIAPAQGDSGAMDPGPAAPELAEPTSSEWEYTEPGPVEPEAVDAERVEPAAAEPETTKQDPEEPGAAEPEPAAAEPSQPAAPEAEERPAEQEQEETGSIEPADAGQSAEPAQPTERAEPTGPLPPEPESETTGRRPVYVDPAGRFSLELPPGWPDAPSRLSLRGTAFEPPASEAVYVYVLPVPSPGASASTIARSALATYQETQPGFTVVVEPRPTTLDGQAAYEAFYRYDAGAGRVVSEWGVFTRRGDRAFYVQYAREGLHEPEPFPAEYQGIKNSFKFGPTPGGAIDPESLSGSLVPYVDRETGYRLLVPSLWPLADQADDGSSVTFVEIGERGYLTVFTGSGTNGLQARDIIAVWRNEWTKERGFRLVRDLYDVEIDGRRGVGLEYQWLGDDDSARTGKLIAVVDSDRLFTVVLDYVTSGFDSRRETFDRILMSFDLLEANDLLEAVEQPPGQEIGDEGGTPPPAREPGGDDGAPEGPDLATGREEPATADWPFQEPADDESVILLGRLLTRYRPGGVPTEEWVAGAVVFVRVGGDVYTGVTDEQGHVYVSNLPRLSGGQFYEVTRVQAPMFGYDRPVAISFQNLEVGQIAPRVAYMGIVEVTLEPDGILTVEVRRPQGSDAADLSSLDHFARTYPASRWTPFVREAMLVRGRM